MPDLVQLRAFVAVAEELNFTRAGRRLHLGQQAVSKSVASLEDQLGVELFTRTSRQVTLTPAGESLLRSGRDVLARARAAFDEAQMVGHALAGTARICLTPAVGGRLRDDVVTVLTAQSPEFRVVFRGMRLPDAERALSGGEVDVVLSRMPPSSESLDRAELAGSPAQVIVSVAHPLAAAGVISPRELGGQHLQVWNPRGHIYTTTLVERLADAGARVEPVLARISGDGGPPTLHANEFALLPVGWSTGSTAVALDTEPQILLPLWLMWPRGSVPGLVGRLRDAFQSAGDTAIT